MWQRIDDYALLGDCHSAALVGRDGGIDWACFPRFDSPTVFCRILDARRGGTFRVAPEGAFRSTRQYLEDTNVLVTTFTTRGGVLELTDCMPVKPDLAHGTRVGTRHALLRRVRCLAGEVPVRVVVAPRFEYGAFVPRISLTSPNTAELVGGADALWVTATRPLEAREDALRARWRLRAGEEAWVEVAWTPSLVERSLKDMPSPEVMHRRLEETVTFWRGWIARCAYEGEYMREVRRSALVLKALTYAPSGAVVAAPTTSLPEEPGGERNWDYRYTWMRDTSLTLISLMVLGYQEEVLAFRHWLRRTSAGRAKDLQIMYDLRGHRLLPEVELPHLSGHRGSRPVRIGNGAVKQLQLDVFGEMLEAAWLYAKMGGVLSLADWDFLRGLVEEVCVRWRQPDQGLWEIRDTPRHFLHSKLFCWVALDRAVRMARARRLPAPVGRWVRERELLHDSLMHEARRRRTPRCCSCPRWASCPRPTRWCCARWSGCASSWSAEGCSTATSHRMDCTAARAPSSCAPSGCMTCWCMPGGRRRRRSCCASCWGWPMTWASTRSRPCPAPARPWATSPRPSPTWRWCPPAPSCRPHAARGGPGPSPMTSPTSPSPTTWGGAPSSCPTSPGTRWACPGYVDSRTMLPTFAVRPQAQNPLG